jgi:hypothetical protein
MKRRRYGNMPTIARLENSLKIMVYARDPTHGPHIHVAYEGKESVAVRIRIDDGKVIQARPGVIKAQDLREAVLWLKNNRVFAREEWDKLNPLVHDRGRPTSTTKRSKRKSRKNRRQRSR